MPFCIAGVPIVPVFHLGAAGGATIPFWAQQDEFGDTNLLVAKPAEGHSLARALGSHAAVLMRHHGATVVGGDLRELVSRSIFMCQNAVYQLQAQSLGKVVPLTLRRDQARGLAQRAAERGGTDLGILVAPARRDRTDCRRARRPARPRHVRRRAPPPKARPPAASGRDPDYVIVWRPIDLITHREDGSCTELAQARWRAQSRSIASLAGSSAARADDQLKVAIGQINNWENQMPTLGQDAGIFKKYGLTLDNFGTAGAGETMQPIIAGSADIGIGVGVAGVMRVFAKGAPVRILLPAFTGTGDLYWYVKADSPLKSLADTTDKNTIAYSTSGSSTNNIVAAFVQELGVKAKPIATGSPPATLTAVMSGQVDIGWGAFPMALKEVDEGKIRIIARGSDVASLDKQTVRVVIVNADVLKSRKDAVLRFAKAYREAVDWMYSDPDAIKRYAQKVASPEDFVRRSIPKIYPKSVLQTDEMKDLDGIQSDAVKLKFLDQPLSKEQLAELMQIPPR